MDLPKRYPVPVKLEDGFKAWFSMSESQYAQLCKHIMEKE
jgi:hypothetical protein